MQALDQNVLNFFAANRVEWLSFFMLVITYCGSFLVIGSLTFLSALSFYVHKHSRRILPLIVSVSGSAITMYIVKYIFDKARPVSEALYLEASPAFPSGHATMAMALYGFIFYVVYKFDHHYLKKALLIFLAVLILLIGVSRLYLGVHYLSDVLAGFIIGFVWILISRSISKSKSWRLRGNERL